VSKWLGPPVQLYHQLRTAHLEWAAELPPTAILFGAKRYDFDAADRWMFV
jgi:hypothetical protein